MELASAQRSVAESEVPTPRRQRSCLYRRPRGGFAQRNDLCGSATEEDGKARRMERVRPVRFQDVLGVGRIGGVPWDGSWTSGRLNLMPLGWFKEKSLGIVLS